MPKRPSPLPARFICPERRPHAKRAAPSRGWAGGGVTASARAGVTRRGSGVLSIAAAISVRVYSSSRVVEDLLGRPLLDDLAALHDDDVVGHGAHHREVVADEEIGELVRALQVAQQLDDLLLHRAVERRGRLVEHDRPSASGSWRGRWRCAGAGRRRIRADSGCACRDRGRPRRSASTARRSRSLRGQRRLVDEQALGDDLPDRHARRQRAERVLEDDLQLAPQRPHLRAVGRRDVAGRRSGSRPSLGSSRSSARPSVDLPEPIRRRCRSSAPRCSVDARRGRRRADHAAGRRGSPPPMRKIDLDVAALEQDAARRRQRRLASRRARRRAACWCRDAAGR